MIKRLLDYFQNISSPSEPEPEIIIPKTNLNNKQIRQRSQSFDDKYTTKIATQEMEEIDCSVCLSLIKNGNKYKELKCNHKYHEACIKNWVVYKNKQKCPMCVTFIQGMNETIVKGRSSV